MKFKLPYYVSNNGDGSVSLNTAKSLVEAEKLDEAQTEGWAEPSSGEIDLKVEAGKLYVNDFVEIDGRYQQVWVEIEQPIEDVAVRVKEDPRPEKGLVCKDTIPQADGYSL